MTQNWEEFSPRKVRWVLWLMLALTFAAVGWAWTARVQVYALAPGVLEPKGQLASVTASTAGRVTRVQVDAARQVRKGDLLYVVDAVGASPEEARMQLEASQARLEEGRQATVQARERLAQQARIARLQTELFAGGAISRMEYLEAQENLRQAQAALRVAESGAVALEAQHRALAARRSVKTFSPATGRVVTRHVRRVGEVVAAGQVLAEILPQDVPLIFKAYVPERERPKLRLGAEAEVSWNAFPRQRFGVSRGRITALSATSLVRERVSVYEIEIALDSLKLKGPEGARQIVAGMAGEARVVAARRTVLTLFWDWIRGVNPWG